MSFDEQNFHTTETIQILESVQSNVCMYNLYHSFMYTCISILVSSTVCGLVKINHKFAYLYGFVRC